MSSGKKWLRSVPGPHHGDERLTWWNAESCKAMSRLRYVRLKSRDL